MWPHPHDVLKAIQQGHQPRIIAVETSCSEEPDRNPNVLVAFKKAYPVDGAADRWVPWMELINTPLAPKPATPLPKPKATPVAAAVPEPPQPREREEEEELERPAKKRSLLSMLNAHMAQKIGKRNRIPVRAYYRHTHTRTIKERFRHYVVHLLVDPKWPKTEACESRLGGLRSHRDSLREPAGRWATLAPTPPPSAILGHLAILGIGAMLGHFGHLGSF